MDLISKRQVWEVLDFWKLVELLGQVDIPEDNEENKQNIRYLLDGMDVEADRIDVFRDLNEPEADIALFLDEDSSKFVNYTFTTDQISVCMGSINRNKLIDYLLKYVGTKDDLPEKSYSDDSKISLFSFRVEKDGKYVPGSFQLSPVIWAISEWNTTTNNTLNYRLNKTTYDTIIRDFDNNLQDRNVRMFLNGLYLDVMERFWRDDFEKSDTFGKVIYSRFKDESVKKDFTINHANLSRSCFLDDLNLFTEAFANDTFNDKTKYGKQVGEYILAPYEKKYGRIPIKRTIIGAKEDRESMKKFFEMALDPKRLPLGKWPLGSDANLMQQVVVNMAVDESTASPLLTVNCPPGTGKMNIIKDVVANNLVLRAEIIANAENVEDIIDDDKINEYGIMIASYSDSTARTTTDTLNEGMDEPFAYKLGYKTDITEYCETVLRQFMDNFKDDKSDFKAIRAEFLEQLKKVKSMRTELESVYKAAKSIPDHPRKKIEEDIRNIGKYKSDVDDLDERIQALEADIMRIDGGKKGFFVTRKAQQAKEAMISERKRSLENLTWERDEKNKKYLAIRNSKQSLETLDKYSEQMTVINREFFDKMYSNDASEAVEVHSSNPWITEEFNYERKQLFVLACRLHREYLLSSTKVKERLNTFVDLWNRREGRDTIPSDMMIKLIQCIFMVTPVVTTTFEESRNIMGFVRKNAVLGKVIINEAAQAQPQMAMGILYRARSALILGDPKQAEPKVTREADIIKHLISSELINCYQSMKLSVQSLADFANPYGCFLGEGDEKIWVGIPLVLHNTCIEPIFSIANSLSYDNTMKLATEEPAGIFTLLMDDSAWIHVEGNENGFKDLFVKKQGQTVMQMLTRKFEIDDSDIPALYVITPFESVKEGMIKMIKESDLYKNDPRCKEWLSENIDIVSTFRGKGTDEVIFLLGVDESSKDAINFVRNYTVNVAITRASYRIYVIGDKDIWTCEPLSKARELINNTIDSSEL